MSPLGASTNPFSHKTSQISHDKVVSFILLLDEYANKIFHVWFCVTKCDLFSCLKFLTISHNSSPVENPHVRNHTRNKGRETEGK